VTQRRVVIGTVDETYKKLVTWYIAFDDVSISVTITSTVGNNCGNNVRDMKK